MKRYFFFILWLTLIIPVYSQQTPTIGISDRRPGIFAFTNATIYVDYNHVMKGATLLVKDGRIEQAGRNLNIPSGYHVKNLEGKTIYPSFIDPYTSYGLSEAKAHPGNSSSQAATAGQGNFYREEDHPVNWNDALHPHYKAAGDFRVDKEAARQYREMGFGTVLSFRSDGIARGTSVLATLSDASSNKAVIRSQASAHYSFDKGTSPQNYPTSLMGSIALLRQTYYDARWYQRCVDKPFTDITLEAWNENRELPQIFEVEDKHSLLRADKLGDESGIQYIIKGAGDEYQMIDRIKNTGAPLIVPLDFPEAPSVEDPYKADQVSLQELRHWEMAPAAFSILAEHAVPFAITSQGHDDAGDFLENLRMAVRYGLPKEAALKALTHTPAQLLRVDDRLGSLEQGKMANFIITSGDLFEPSSVIHENWVQGKLFVLQDMERPDHRGQYALEVGEVGYELNIKGKPGSEQFELTRDDMPKIKAEGEIEESTLHIQVQMPEGQSLRLAGWKEDARWQGTAWWSDGKKETWQAQRRSTPEKEKQKREKSERPGLISKMTFPFKAYGFKEEPVEKDYLITSATVWTNEDRGIVRDLDVLVRNGKIHQVGKDLRARDAVVIDGSGKHLTSGVIDEHSHIAITGGTNEFSHAITPEVRINDVLDPEDINIYRQLSGGVTAAQLLHGSANPVGGQSAVIKHRWGASADELLIDGATPFLKHALGENVKQSRLPASVSSRYPQSRMGVEAIIRDAYLQASEYKKDWDDYNSLSEEERKNALMPRRNLRMEALVDVLEQKSYITCHTYVQSETNMIMNLAEDFGIRAHTLIHNTEGYKIADKLKSHGVYASNLPDWWAYKFEVYDAIPYNTALQSREGIVSAIHSDNAELARRLNQEAAKTVKYGGLSEEEAWKLVTLNPAKILHLDHRMGSIREGKDADLVLWSHNPLSIYARAEKTLVDGILYYDQQKDQQMRNAAEEERLKLIDKIINENQK
jgi:imidazolonepropionase-like amidohydrolase